MTPFTVQPVPTDHDIRYRIVGPGTVCKAFDAQCRERLDELAAMLNAAFAAGVEAGIRAAVKQINKKG